MRSRAEIAFRLKQEGRNVLLRLLPPSLPGSPPAPGPLPFLPDPAPVFQRLTDTEFARDCERIADLILNRRIPLLGHEITTESRIRWRRDYFSGIETPPLYFRRIPYLDAKRAGDHKVIWELNRHQHLVLLAQAYWFTGKKEYLADIEMQLDTWLEDNPYQRGMNWASSLEVAFRALSWVWLLHFVGDRFGENFRERFLTGLYRHAEHVATNLSVYFSPNTHLLGEAVALHALGLLFAAQPSGRRWAEQGSRIVQEQMSRQVRHDGSHFEQSTYYHVYALDMFLFEAILQKSQGRVPPDPYISRLAAMAQFLDCLMPEGDLPFFGDDDGGRFFHPYGDRTRFGAATLASCRVLLPDAPPMRDASRRAGDVAEQAVWWFGEAALDPEPAVKTAPPACSVRFPDSGMVVMTSGSMRILCDAGPFGPGSAGHSHSDTLSVVVADAAEELLIDPGTYTYVASAEWRNRFRGSGAHNTIRVDSLDQAGPAGPFRWSVPPQVETLRWSANAEYDLLIASCRARGILHQRSILFIKRESAAIIVDDVTEAGTGESHLVEQFWHPGSSADQLSSDGFAIGKHATLTLWSEGQQYECTESEGGEFGWRSPFPSVKHEAILLRVQKKGPLPVRFAAVIDFRGNGIAGTLVPNGKSSWTYDGPRRVLFEFD